MGDSAEAIGRLLADSSLLRGERNLLRKQDEPVADAPKAAAPAAAALMHDAKATAAVLLTLLDERLAIETEREGGDALVLGGARRGAEASGTPPSLAAKYADDLNSPSDSARFDPVPAGQQLSFANLIATSSPELQSFMQRLAVVADEHRIRDEPLRSDGLKRIRYSSLAQLSENQVVLTAAILLGIAVLVAAYI